MTRPAPARETPFALLWWAAYPGAASLAKLALLLIGIWICELSIPLLLGDTVDAAVGRTGGYAPMARYGATACAVAAVLYVLHWAYLRAETRVISFGTFRLRRHLYERILEQPISSLGRVRTGEAVQKLMSDTEVLDSHAIYVLADAPFCAMTLLGIFAVMAWMQLHLALLVCAVLIVVVLLSKRVARPLPTMERLTRHRWARLSGRLQETLEGLRTVKLCGAETCERARFDSEGERLMRCEIALGSAVAQLEPLLQMMAALGFLVVVCYGSILVYRGSLSPGRLVAFVAYMELMCEPIGDIGVHVAHYQRSVGTFRRISTFLKQLPPPWRGGTSAIAGPFDIEMDAISFAYRPDSLPVLNGVSLRASPGEIIAVAGHNGAGKSTLMDILLGLLRPDRGSILAGGIPLDDWDLAAWHSLTAAIPQTIFLFHASIGENIRYGAPAAARRDVEAVAECVGLSDVLARLPRGLDTIVGNAGERLSGGERQRVALARALLRRPRLLVLDEADSALDASAQPHLHRALREHREERVTFIVSHSPLALAVADRVAVLEQGGIKCICDSSERDRLQDVLAGLSDMPLDKIGAKARKGHEPVSSCDNPGESQP